MCLVARVNRRCRDDAPSPQFARQHCRKNVNPDHDLLQEHVQLMVNIFIARNTLSHSAREGLKAGVFVWGKVSLETGDVANLDDLFTHYAS
eukprot:2694097-Pyramimonas_sp.AAC.1